MADNIFKTLSAVNVNDKKEQKNKLDYLSWAWAWSEVKSRYPDTISTVYENADGWNYHTDGRTCWVKVGVTVCGLEHIEYLPVMDYNNRSIPADKVTSFDVNKAIQRAMTKAIARHGLGLYIYAGEDLPDAADDAAREAVNAAVKKPAAKTYKPMTDERFKQYVEGAARGQQYNGKGFRDLWIKATNAGPEEVEMFDKAVFSFKINNDLQ